MSEKDMHPCVRDPGIAGLAEDLRLISDPNRLRIICLLSKGEKRVSEILRDLSVSQQLASHHLNALKSGGLLSVRKEKTSSYYRVDAQRLERINQVYRKYLDHHRIKGAQKPRNPAPVSNTERNK